MENQNDSTIVRKQSLISCDCGAQAAKRQTQDQSVRVADLLHQLNASPCQLSAKVKVVVGCGSEIQEGKVGTVSLHNSVVPKPVASQAEVRSPQCHASMLSTQGHNRPRWECMRPAAQADGCALEELLRLDRE